MPDPEEHLMTVFTAALECVSATDRDAYLERACAGDSALRVRVDALLRAHDRAGGFLGRGPGPAPTPEPTTAEPAAGTLVAGRYKLLERVGEGGMGEVWMAEQAEPVRRTVALKLIKPGMDTRAVVARFEAERQALALMDHPNIAKVLDGGVTEGGRPFFVMELVKGVPITRYCDDKRLTVRDRLALFADVCRAVQHAHQKGVIHRDLKPSNVLVAPYDGRPVAKVIDFGVAKATGRKLTEATLFTGFGAVVGTPEYMSPEQAEVNNQDIDTRSDVYSLGVLLYELLTGTTPLTRRRVKEAALLEVLRLVREEEPPRPSTRLSSTAELPAVAAVRGTEPARLARLLRGELDWIVMKALEKDRARRYETATGLAADVDRYLADEPVLVCPPGAAYRLRKFARKHRAELTTAAAIAFLLVAGTAVSAWQAWRATRAERAEGEKRAKEQAQKRLAQIEKGNEIITAIFADLDIRAVKAGTEPLGAVLAGRLVKAGGELEGEAVGDPLVVAGLQERLGRSLYTLGHARDAIPLFAKARAARLARLGADHPDTLSSTNSLAISYRDAGKPDLAVPLLEESLKVMTAKLGADHPDTLTLMNNLAMGYQEAGKLDLALPLLEEALRLKTARLGADHPDTLICMGNLGRVYRDSGRSDLALPLLEEVVKQFKAQRGPDHPLTLTGMNELAMTYRAAGKLDRAVPLCEELVTLRKARLGADHPDTLTSMVTLASAYRDAGKPDLALPLNEEALKRYTAKLGADHPHTLVAMNNLAMGYQDAGKLDLALPLLEEALRLKTARLGADHPDTLAGMNNLAIGYRAAGKLDLAIPLCEEAVKRRKAVLGVDHPDTLVTMHHLAACYRDAQKWPEGEAVLRECLAVRERQQPDAWETFMTRSILGGALLRQKKYADAEPLLVQGYEGMKARAKSIPPKHKGLLAEAADRLVKLYEATGRMDAAARWRKELEALNAAAGAKPPAIP
jgi:serine/threonine protein kinase/tetratricopeptide (TPR) repeat protein